MTLVLSTAQFFFFVVKKSEKWIFLRDFVSIESNLLLSVFQRKKISRKNWDKTSKKSPRSSSCSFNYHKNMYYSNQVNVFFMLLTKWKFFSLARLQKNLPKESKNLFLKTFEFQVFFFVYFFSVQIWANRQLSCWMPWEERRKIRSCVKEVVLKS